MPRDYSDLAYNFIEWTAIDPFSVRSAKADARMATPSAGLAEGSR